MCDRFGSAATILAISQSALFREHDRTAPTRLSSLPKRLRYANCGHLSGLLLRSDNTLEWLESTCTVLGLFKEWDCSIGECRLFSGDTLALYTDRVTEAFNEAGEEFGEQRLIEALRRHHEPSSNALLRAIIEDVQRFSPHEQHDDITLILAQCR